MTEVPPYHTTTAVWYQSGGCFGPGQGSQTTTQGWPSVIATKARRPVFAFAHNLVGPGAGSGVATTRIAARLPT